MSDFRWQLALRISCGTHHPATTLLHKLPETQMKHFHPITGKVLDKLTGTPLTASETLLIDTGVRYAVDAIVDDFTSSLHEVVRTAQKDHFGNVVVNAQALQKAVSDFRDGKKAQ